MMRRRIISKMAANIKKKFVEEIKRIGDSFKRCNVNIIFVVFLDLVFFASLVYLPMLWNKIIMKHPLSEKIAVLQGGGLQLLDLGAAELAEIKGLMGGFIVSLIVSLLVLVFLIYLIHSITRALIWLVIHNKKGSRDFFKKMMVLNLMWVPILVLILVLFLVVKAPVDLYSYKVMILYYVSSVIFMLILFVPLSLNFMVYHYYTKKGGIMSSMGEAFKVFFTQIRHFIIPFVVMLLVFYLVSLPFGLIPSLFANYKIVYALVIIIYIGWLRFYLVEVLDSIKHTRI